MDPNNCFKCKKSALNLFEGIDFDDGFVFLGDHEAARVGRAQHVDEQLVGKHVQLLHLLTLQVNLVYWSQINEN